MKTKLIGLIASVALMGSGAALAGDDWKKQDKQQTQSQGATGGSGQVTEGSSGQVGQGSSGQVGQGGSGQVGQGGSGQGSSGQMNQGTSVQLGSTQQLGANEITGRVVKSSKKMVWVEHAGAVVPLTINKQTQFADPSLKRAQDLREGDQVRASFEVRETANIATNIQKSDSSLGGSGTGTGTDTDIGSGTGSGSSTGGSGSGIPNPGTLPPSPIDDGTGGSGTDTGLEPPDVGDEGTSSDLGSDSNRAGDY